MTVIASNKNLKNVSSTMANEVIFTNQISFFENLDSLKIMLVLYRDNPDVSFNNLQKEARMDSNTLQQILASLIKAELVHVKQETKEQVFTLSQEARMLFNRLNTPRALIIATA